MRKSLFVFFVILIYIGCNTADNEGPNTIKSYYDNGRLKSRITIINGKKEGLEINFYPWGFIKSIQSYRDNKLHGEQYYFYGSGYLEQKNVIKDGVADGPAFTFYNDGAIKNFRFYSNGKEVLYGVDYWQDSIPMTKSSLHFNDSGHIYYKKNFDKEGNFISEEGHRK